MNKAIKSESAPSKPQVVAGGDYLDRLVGHFWNLKTEFMDAIRQEYPIGSRVIFWRSANQKKESFGTVLGHSMAYGPELRVRYDNSKHVIGLHVGHTKFHSLPNDQGEAQPPAKKL